MLGERGKGSLLEGLVVGKCFYGSFVVNGWGWLLAFAGTKSGMGEAREMDCGIQGMTHGKGMAKLQRARRGVWGFEEKKLTDLLSSG